MCSGVRIFYLTKIFKKVLWFNNFYNVVLGENILSFIQQTIKGGAWQSPYPVTSNL